MEKSEMKNRDITTRGEKSESVMRESSALFSERLSGLKAGSADVLTLGVTIYQSTDTLDVWIPTATGTTV